MDNRMGDILVVLFALVIPAFLNTGIKNKNPKFLICFNINMGLNINKLNLK